MFINSCYILVVMIVCFPFLGFADGSLSVSYIFVCVVSILGLCFPSSTFCRAGFLDTYCLKLVLSWNILFSPSMVTESFAGYSSLALNPWSLMYAAHLPSIFWLHGFHWEVRCNSDRFNFISYLTFFLSSS